MGDLLRHRGVPDLRIHDIPAPWAQSAVQTGWQPASWSTPASPAGSWFHFAHPLHRCSPVTWRASVGTSPGCAPVVDHQFKLCWKRVLVILTGRCYCLAIKCLNLNSKWHWSMVSFSGTCLYGIIGTLKQWGVNDLRLNTTTMEIPVHWPAPSYQALISFRVWLQLVYRLVDFLFVCTSLFVSLNVHDRHVCQLIRKEEHITVLTCVRRACTCLHVWLCSITS